MVVERGVSVGVKPAEPFNLAVPPPGMAGVAGVRAFAPTMAMGAVAAYASNATVNNEDLGEQIIEGVLVRGSRQTQTIAAGAIGNERAIDIVAEEWYSDEIEAVVLRRNFDPRFGETQYELTNIVRSEPSPDLFTVPQGYELIEDRVEGPRLGVTSGPPPAGAERAERRVFIVQPERAKEHELIGTPRRWRNALRPGWLSSARRASSRRRDRRRALRASRRLPSPWRCALRRRSARACRASSARDAGAAAP